MAQEKGVLQARGGSLSLQEPLLKQQQQQQTGDGSVDMHGKPASKGSSGGNVTSLGISTFAALASITSSSLSYSLVHYLTKVLEFSPAAAARNVSTWVGVMYMSPLIGAYVADTLLGRFWATVAFAIVCLLGDALLTLSASVKFLKPLPPPVCSHKHSPCPPANSSLQMLFFYSALYMTAVGNGFTSTAQAFGADQYDKTDKLESLHKSSFFNWYYFSLSSGSLIAGLVVVHIQEWLGFAWGCGLIGIFVAVGLLVFLIFTPKYRHLRPPGNPFLLIPQVLFAAIRKIHLKLPFCKDDLYNGDGSKNSRHSPRAKALRFLDKAAINHNFGKGMARNPWQLCTLAEVDEVKSVFQILPMWFCSVIYGLLWTHMVSMFVEQGAMMNLQVGSIQISPSSLNSLDPFNVLLWTLIYQQILRPWCAHLGKNAQGLTVLQRMSVGLIMVMVAMICAAMVESRRLRLIRELGLQEIEMPAPMSVLWQIPQYSLVGASEVFYCVGHHEFFYNEIADAMRTLGSALPLLAISLGSILSGLLVTFISNFTASGGSHGWIPRNLNQGHLDWYFWLLAAISAANLAYFFVCAQSYASEQTLDVAVFSSIDEAVAEELHNPALSVV